MTPIVLHDYQREAVQAAMRSLRRGRSPLLIAPTGTGKTVIGGEIARLRCGKTKRALVVAGRDVLLDQWADRFAALGVSADIEQGGRRASARARVVIASAQTVSREARAFDHDAFALVVLDEAHHSASPSWSRIAKHYRCPKLGLTATADRLDGKALEVFDEIAYELDMLSAIERGLIVPLVQRSVTVEAIDVSRIRLMHGDLRADQLSDVLTKVEALQGVAVPMVDHIGHRRTLAFAATVAHARALAEQLNRLRPGIARAVAGEDRDRDEALADFRARRFQVLVNCDLYREGFDEPGVSCIAMARPTASRSLYAQAIGRGTRLAPGKSDCLVMDFVGNAGRHDLMTSFSLLERPEERAEVVRAAKDIVEREPDTRTHEAMERARVLPGEVLERYRIADAVAMQTCARPGCNRMIAQHRANEGQKCCSRDCSGWMRRRPTEASRCGNPHCREMLTRHQVVQGKICHSPACAYQLARHRARERLSAKSDVKCARPGCAEFMTVRQISAMRRKGGTHTPEFHSAKCARACTPLKGIAKGPSEGTAVIISLLCGGEDDREIAAALSVPLHVVHYARYSRWGLKSHSEPA